MTPNDLQKMYKFDLRVNPDNGLLTPLHAAGRRDPQHAARVQHQPDVADRLLRPRRAGGPLLAPANSADCIQLKAGDCAPRTLLIRAPFFTRFDIGVTKRFPLGGSVNFELRVDVLNVFDNINFNPVAESRQPAADDLPGDDRLSRSGQHVRSGRPARAARVPVELVRAVSEQEEMRRRAHLTPDTHARNRTRPGTLAPRSGWDHGLGRPPRGVWRAEFLRDRAVPHVAALLASGRQR